jgi:hypothetical protein
MTTIFIVKGLGFGDDENAYENLQAFSTQALADAHVAALREEDAAEDNDFEYEIEPITLD